MVMTQSARQYQAFYTKSTPIVDYMLNKLMLKTSDQVFEPCAGDGVFVEAIIDRNKFVNIDICELNDDAYKTLLDKFSHYPNVNVRHCDTLLDSDLILSSNFGGIYDKIVANPPYGAWQGLDKRAELKNIYPSLYVKETYTLFLFRCIELLKNGGILSFIIPDTFLNLHMHRAIRHHILTKTKILELALFPSSFFPNVNFGYANLSIITLQKSDSTLECLANEFKVLRSFKNVEQLSKNCESELNTFSFRQQQILDNQDYALLVSDDLKVTEAINNCQLKIGDIASCVTGFYSGDDKTFLQVHSHELKNGKRYNLVDHNLVNSDYQNIPNILDGIDGKKYFLPILKGGNVKYLKEEHWFMDWSQKAVNHYKTDKKPRFQNPQYYFKFGIGVPMISSSSITASLIENKLFDQSIVGIFPQDKSLTYFLLAFFNSPTCNKLIRTINPSANNPANYIKKIPFVTPSDEQKILIDSNVKKIISGIKKEGGYNKMIEIELNEVIEIIYGF
jgi:hypothetical protein